MNHYFTNDANLKSELRLIPIKVLDRTYLLYSDNGVFAKDGLDYGTRLLLESLPYNDMSGSILDVGCGYGPIGLVVRSKVDCKVDMIDVNLRALHLTKMSADKNQLDVDAYESDAYSNVKGKYDYILTNPPIRVGKKKVYEILIGAHQFLNENGELWFVMRKDQGVKSTLLDIESYYNLSIKNKKKGFFVICATKKVKSVDNA